MNRAHGRQSSPPLRCVITGGGTGGHAFSALAIARALPGCELLFIGAAGKMEMQWVRAAGFSIVGLWGLWMRGWIRGYSLRSLLGACLLPFLLLLGIGRAYFLLRSFKPSSVVGVGGYASFPALCAAFLHGIPIVLHEQNGVFGRANAFFLKIAKRICVAYDTLCRSFAPLPVVCTGNPVRPEIISAFRDIPSALAEQKKQHACASFGLSRHPVVLVLGGSLGSRSLNRAFLGHIRKVIAQGWSLLWQVGHRDFPWVSDSLVFGKERNICAVPFIEAMPDAYQAADLIVSRAGALTLAELCVVGKPVVLVPSPNVTNDHQHKNAQFFVAQKAVWLVEDEHVYARLMDVLCQLVADASLRRTLASNLRSLAVHDAADRVAKEIYSLQHRKHEGI